MMKPNTDTTHQNASEALRKEVELYRRIIEALSDFVFIFDENEDRKGKYQFHYDIEDGCIFHSLYSLKEPVGE